MHPYLIVALSFIACFVLEWSMVRKQRKQQPVVIPDWDMGKGSYDRTSFGIPVRINDEWIKL